MSIREHPSASHLKTLWDRARGGCEDSVGKLLESYRPYLLAIANATVEDHVRPKMAPSDLVQETIFRAHAGFPEFHGTTDADLQCWLRQILKNQLIDSVRFSTAARRDVRRETSLHDSPAPKTLAGHPAPDDQVVLDEQYRLLLKNVNLLPSRQQCVVKSYHEEGLSFSQIGRRLECSAETARRIWFQALDRLAKRMET